MNWLWLLLLIPVGVFVVGVLVYALSSEDPPFTGGKPREVAEGLYNLTAMGCVSTLALAVVFGPALLLYRAAHLPYWVSASVGLLLGIGILVGLAVFWMAKSSPVDTPEQTPKSHGQPESHDQAV